MIINDTIFNVDLLSIITTLKFQLDKNNIPLLYKFFESGDDVMVCCPYHKDGQERRPSAGIRKSDGLFHCLACGETHSLPEVISYCLGFNDPFGREGYKWLCRNFSSVEVENRESIQIDMERSSISSKSNLLVNCNHSKLLCVSEEELDSYRYTHPYMYKRGLNDIVIDLFDIGYDRRTDSITFPVRDINGSVLFVARRSVSGKRFDIPRGIEKPLYGLFEVDNLSFSASGDWLNEVYVCEGLFDCLRLWCNNRPAVAGFGCLFSDYQIKQLNELPTRKLILATDNDKAGLKARERLRSTIKGKLITEVELPNGRKDIGECTDDELLHLNEVF